MGGWAWQPGPPLDGRRGEGADGHRKDESKSERCRAEASPALTWWRRGRQPGTARHPPLALEDGGGPAVMAARREFRTSCTLHYGGGIPRAAAEPVTAAVGWNQNAYTGRPRRRRLPHPVTPAVGHGHGDEPGGRPLLLRKTALGSALVPAPVPVAVPARAPGHASMAVVPEKPPSRPRCPPAHQPPSCRRVRSRRQVALYPTLSPGWPSGCAPAVHFCGVHSWAAAPTRASEAAATATQQLPASRQRGASTALLTGETTWKSPPDDRWRRGRGDDDAHRSRRGCGAHQFPTSCRHPACRRDLLPLAA